MLNIDFTFFIQWANFLVLIGIIHFCLVKPVLRFVEERKKGIRTDVEEAAKKNQASQEILASIELKLSLLHKAANEDMVRFRAEVNEMSREKIDKARAEALAETDLARDTIQREVVQIKDQLRRKSEEMALIVAEKILGRKIGV